MSDFKFACPTCGQHIAGDERWAGAQIKCPSCQADMMVPPLETAPAAPPPPPPPVRVSVAPTPAAQAPSAPATAAAPAPPTPPASPVRLSLTPAPKAHSAPTPPAAPTAPVSPPPSAPPKPGAGPAPKPYVPSYLKPEAKQSKAKAILTVAIVLVVLGVAVAVVAPMINSAQNKMNEQRKKDSEDADGGQVGHVMELNRMLDATDPARFERGAGESKRPQLKEPPYSLDVATAAIPSGEVRGKISNQGFLLNDAYLEVNGAMHVLYLIHGMNMLPEPIVLISLRLNPGESIQGKSWTIAKETTAGVPAVAKKWLASPTAPPKQVPFTSGYAMKLEFGKAVEGIIAGKIYLALPDPEQSVIAGEFQADIRVATPVGARPGRQQMPAFGDD